MIVKMKKVHVLALATEALSAIEELRSLGLIHVEHLSVPKGGKLEGINERITQVEQALSSIEKSADVLEADQQITWAAAVEEITALSIEAEGLKDRIIKTKVSCEHWQAWGDFDPKDVAGLRDKGLCVAFFEGNESDLKQFSQTVTREVISRSGKIVRVLLCSREVLTAPGVTYELPTQRVSEMKRSLTEDALALKAIDQKMSGYVAYRPVLQKALADLLQERTFEETAEGMMKQDKLAALKGFCPEDRVTALEDASKQHGWGLLVEDPAEDDRTPTFLRNPTWVQSIMPLLDFMNIIPGYKESDVSLCFLVFFSLFFGILIGDAGYGCLFMAVTLFAHRKAQKGTDPSVFRLMYILSGCAILWGAATGTFFGVSLFGQWIKPVVPWLTNDKNVQLLCFMIGITHLTLAHVWRGMRKLPSIAALGDVGWICLLWCAYFFCGQILLERSVPSFVMPMIWIGGAIVILFNQPNKNILKAAGMGMSDLLLGIMGVFIDLVSYIRLFAVGAAGLALAESFNAAATTLGFSNVLVGFGTALILVLGHTLNIVLSLMAVLVHGVRLNILEFSGHQGIEWTGMKYEPFKKAESLE